MPISISCNHCNAQLKLRDSLAGKRIACPKCQGVLTVPLVESPLELVTPIDDDLSSWDIPHLNESSNTESNSTHDPFGLPAMEIPTPSLTPMAAPFAVPVPTTNQRTQNQAPQPTENKSKIPTSSLLVAFGAGFFVMIACVGAAIFAIKALIATNDTARLDEPHRFGPSPVIVVTEEIISSSPITEPTVAPTSETPVNVTPPPIATNSVAPTQSSQPKITKKAPQAPTTNTPRTTYENTQFPRTTMGRHDEAQYVTINSAITLIKMSSSSETKVATGFLIDVNNHEGYIVTTADVVSPSSGAPNEISCVFHSGTDSEFTTAASLTGKDESLDLAILKVQHTKLPEHIRIDQDDSPSIQDQVYCLGFPGNGNNTNDSPSSGATLTEHKITDLKNDEFDIPYLVQIDKPFNKGSSGSPVFASDGQLHGVAVSRKPFDDQQSYFIPRAALGDLLGGRITHVNKRKSNNSGKLPSYTLEMELIDPKESIESVTINAFEYSNQTKKTPSQNGKWELASTRMLNTTKCQLTKQSATADFVAPADAIEVMLQYVVKRKSGEWFSEPIPLSKGENATSSIAKSFFSKSSYDTEPSTENSTENLTTITLPSAFADFVIHPTNGNIVGVDPLANEAVLFDIANNGDKVAAIKKVPVGTEPTSITYKKFGDKEYYAVVCNADSNLYLIDAKDFKLAEQITIPSETNTEVIASINPQDPFIYFGYRLESKMPVGVVNLRNMKVTPELFESSSRCRLSADGDTVFKRDGAHVSKWMIGVNDNSPAGDKPNISFRPEGLELDSNIVVDNLGEYFAAGNSLYTMNAKTRLTKLDFAPACFVQSKALIVGLDNVILRIASMNSLTAYDKGIKIPFREEPPKQTNPSATNAASANESASDYQTKILVDEPNERVVVARKDSLFVVPLTAFRIPFEPLLALDVSPKQLRVASNQKITMKPLSEGTVVTYENLPEGATAVADGIEWRPTSNQAGKVKIVATLKNGDRTRTVDCNLFVEQPHVFLPFNVSNFEIHEDDGLAFCWTNEGLPNNEKININAVNIETAMHSKTPIPRVAIVPIKGRGAIETISNTAPVVKAMLIGSRVAVQYANDLTRLELYDRPNMNRVKTIVTSRPYNYIGIHKEFFVLQVGGTREYYNIANLKQATPPADASLQMDHPSDVQFKDGVISNGMLVDPVQRTPKLILQPGEIRNLSGADFRLISGAFLRKIESTKSNAPTTPSVHDDRNQKRLQGPIPIPNKAWNIELLEEIKHIPRLSTRDAQEDRHRVLIRLNAKKSSQRQTIVIVDEPAKAPDEKVAVPRMQITENEVFISQGNKLYRLKIELPKRGTEPEDEVAEPLYFEPQQTSFVVKGTKATLKHIARGGKTPYEFASIQFPEGAKLDESTGQVTLDIDAIAEATRREILKPILGDAIDVDERIEKVLSSARKAAEIIPTKYKGKILGYPVAVPIHLRVVDADGHFAEMQYFVIVDISVRQLRKVLLQK